MADIVSISHALLIILVFIGIGVSVKVKRFRPIEAVLLLSAIVIWSLYGGCPLTTLEAYLRPELSEPLLKQGFIPYYLNNFFNLSISGAMVEIITYILALTFLALSFEWELPIIRKFLKKRKLS